MVSRRGRSEKKHSALAKDHALVKDSHRWFDGHIASAIAPLITGGLMMMSFAPVGLWAIAYLALVPWVLMLCQKNPAKPAIWAFAGGVVYWSLSVYWLGYATIGGYIAAAVYLSLYWVVTVFVVRLAVRRGLGMWIVLPVLWVSIEYSRAYVISGFPWFYLAESQYKQLWLIQIVDATGKYGVTFFVAMVNGLVVDLIRWQWRWPALRWVSVPSRRIVLAGVVSVVVLLAAMVGYSSWRLGENTTSPGPVIAIAQPSIPIGLTLVKIDSDIIFDELLQDAKDLSALARSRGTKLDLVVTPETMMPAGLNYQYAQVLKNGRGDQLAIRAEIERVEYFTAKIAEVSSMIDAPILVGGQALHYNADAKIDADLWQIRNSALLFDRSSHNVGEYSKMHLVPFSESVPFRNSWPWLHFTLRSCVPDIMGQLHTMGKVERFTITPSSGSKSSVVIATPICYEGTFGRVCQKLVMDDNCKVADVLVNLSNDGWFVRRSFFGPADEYPSIATAEQSQHLSQYVFRAIESRIPVVRSVNTGISASIDSCGRIQATIGEMVNGTLLLDGVKDADGGYAVGTGPRIELDDRVTFYSLWGDVFAQAIFALATLMMILLVWTRKHPASTK